MIYLIGGPPRTGKSRLANKILNNNKIAYGSTDVLLHTIKSANPSSNVTDQGSLEEKSKSLAPYFKEYLKYTHYSIEEYVIEGDAFSPRQVSELSYKYDLSACFLGFSKLSGNIVKKYVGFNDWISEMNEKELEDLSDWIVEQSEWINRECMNYNQKYFDLSQDFEATLNQAHDYLINNKDH